jgi:hypothetical protein
MKHINATILGLVLCAAAVAQTSSAWDYSTKTDIAGKTTEFATSWGLTVRCSHSCEVFFTPDRYTLVEDQHSVLVKFNDKPAKRFGVSRSADDTALFFSDPVAILRAIRDNGGYMTVEYKPYQKIPDTVKYGVWNLPPTILKRIELQGNAQKAHAAACAALSDKLSNEYAGSEAWQAVFDKMVKSGCPTN